MRLRQIMLAGALAGSFTMGPMAPAFAAPDGPPNYGVVEPKGENDPTVGCPWPDSNVNHTDAQKCLPQSIPWSTLEHEGVIESGVRIISDALVGVGDEADAAGQVTFRCQSVVGLQYEVTAQRLAPRSTYEVRPVQFGVGPTVLGHFTTDTRGNGILHGTLRLPVGGYGFRFQVFDADGTMVLDMAPEDTVVGIAVLDPSPQA